MNELPCHELTEKHISGFGLQADVLHRAWEESLSSWGVRWPTSPVKLAQLVGLSFFVGEPVSKDSLGAFVKATVGGASDTQARHLRADGWYVVGSGRGPAFTNTLSNGIRMPRGTYALASLVTPIPSFVRSDRLKRQGRIGARDWEELCAYYDGKCAHCGVKVKNPDKGHMDPEKGYDITNLIPLCVECNNWAANDIMFDESGRVTAVLSERFLERAPRSAQKQMLEWLKVAVR